MELDDIFLEDHLCTSNIEEKRELIYYLFSIDKEQGLQDFGYKKDSEGAMSCRNLRNLACEEEHCD